ncbi:hypothetical protein ACFV0L_30150 [Streptosporangium canum]|uniref:hypothetical protein n=1 Tax=Streptosporangium canum TaxID=324952 RepID=UPI003687ED64
MWGWSPAATARIQRFAEFGVVLGPPGGQNLRGDVGEQLVREADLADRVQLEHLPLDRLHAHVAGLFPDHREGVHADDLRGAEQCAVLHLVLGFVAGVGALGDQGEEPRDGRGWDPAGGAGGLGLFGLP